MYLCIFLTELEKKLYEKLSASVDLDSEIGKDGLRAIGVFLRESFIKISLIVEKGNLFLESKCQQSHTRSYIQTCIYGEDNIIDNESHVNSGFIFNYFKLGISFTHAAM